MKFKLSKLIKMAGPICAVIIIVILYCLQPLVIEMYYIEKEDITVTSFSSHPKSYFFFNKGNGFKYDSGKDYICIKRGHYDHLILHFRCETKDVVVYNRGYLKYVSERGISRKPCGKSYVYVQCNMYKVVDVYEDSLKFMLFDTGILDLQSPDERSPACLSHDEFDEYGLQLFRYDEDGRIVLMKPTKIEKVSVFKWKRFMKERDLEW